MYNFKTNNFGNFKHDNDENNSKVQIFYKI